MTFNAVRELDHASKYLYDVYFGVAESYGAILSAKFSTNLPYTLTRDIIFHYLNDGYELSQVVAGLYELGLKKRKPILNALTVYEEICDFARLPIDLCRQIFKDEEDIILTRHAYHNLKTVLSEGILKKIVKGAELQRGQLVRSLQYPKTKVVSKVQVGLERVRVYWTDGSAEFFELEEEFEVEVT